MTDAEYEELKYAAIAMLEKPVRLSDDGTALLMWGIDDPWNPREDDRDAFRLAVDLKIDVSFVWSDGASAWAPGIDPQDVRYGVDRRSTTRLAITRAAAEIGKQMGGGDV